MTNTLRRTPRFSRRFSSLWAGLLLCGFGLAAWSALSIAADDKAAPARKPAAAEAAPPLKLEPEAVFSKFPEWLSSVAFSPDGKTLAIGTFGSIKFFDLESRKERSAVEEPAGYVRSMVYSPDGKTLAVGTYQAAVLWDLESSKVLKRFKGHKGYVNGVAYSPDGKSLASAGEEGFVKVWDLSNLEPRLTLGQAGLGATSVAFSPDGKMLAGCTGDATRPSLAGEVFMWDAADGKELQKIAGHSRPVTGVAFSPDGKQVASCSLDETIKLWDTATGKELQTLEGHSRPVTSLAFLPDGKWLASSAGGRFNGMNDARVWHLPTGECRAILSGHAEPVNQLALAPSGKMLATCSNDKNAALWDIATVLAVETVVADAGKTPAPAKGAEDKTAVAATDEKKTEEKKTEDAKPVKELRAGIIGLDTSHVIAFTQALNDKNAKEDIAGCRVVAAYPKGSPDIESSTSRVPGYTKQMQELGVEIVDSIDKLLEKVDVVMLETNDGRPHLEQVLPVLKAKKPVFIDKPIAGSLADAIAIFAASEEYKVPLFSCSSLRFSEGAQALRNGKIGDITGCDTYSPCSLDATHPDLFWYGIHGVETLFTVMGTGCESVSRVSTPGYDLAAGVWKGGRIGTFRGIREGKGGYGGTAFGTKDVAQVGSYGGYRPLVVEIVKYFRTGVVPVSKEETLEIYAFMEAADESKRQGGKPVTLESVMAKAREAAKAK